MLPIKEPSANWKGVPSSHCYHQSVLLIPLILTSTGSLACPFPMSATIISYMGRVLVFFMICTIQLEL
uniref:Uncharacterized protein n=1 Tax=Pararge aegeria TaxID=116150 RepID=S4PKA6_9NEOP